MSAGLVIVGGGIAGLATAYYSQKAARAQGRHLPITLIEQGEGLGGKIVTDTAGGFVIEGGPDSFITQKPWGYQLCEELGLGDELIGTNDARRRIYILRKGRLHRMPEGLMLVVPTRFLPFALSPIISPLGKLRMGLDLFIPPRREAGDESVAAFMRRRLGQEALEMLGEPLMAGIHVADAERLSLEASFPRFIALEQQHGSLIKGMLAARKQRPASPKALFMTLKGGMGRLVQALEAHLQAEIIRGLGVQSLRPFRADTGADRVEVGLTDGRVLTAEQVVLATPAYVSAALLEGYSAELTALLGGIRYASSATLSLGFRAAEVEHPLDGFGFVVPRRERSQLLACTWTSTKFDHRAAADEVLLRAFVGGHHHPELLHLDDDTLISLVRRELAAIMGIRARPILTRIFRWHRGTAQYDVGHLQRVERIEALLPPGVHVTGSAYRGVGIPDCIHQAQQTARAVLKTFMQQESAIT